MSNNNLPPENLNKLNRDLDRTSGKKGFFRETAEALITAIALAFFIRSFIVEPYKIPSKSMVPSLLVGDHIFVNKFAYGLRIPMTKKWIANFADPKRGEVIIFIYPVDNKLDFVKRVVGLPGDHIQVKEGKVFVNGTEMTLKDIEITGVDPKDRRALLIPHAQADEIPGDLQKLPYYRGFENYQIKVEKLGNKEHLMQKSLLLPNDEDFDTIVPPGHYFVMGDNRDQSADSRVWGFVPRENLKGRAMFIWLSLDSDLGGIRYKRFGKKII